ncbi:uncharacterized protein LOC110732895 [Chenopodium quinoa]|uniref:uncharacterized protein LOC110732895 n=1 Tax=Chenopodium quinoa TaxID=63459 RepID=UPI000B784FDE|nr:uncharacterized protein LOC110732895 [Chenopodium quinoa]
MEVVHWYSVVSVVVVVTAAVGSVYVLWRKNHDHTQPRAAGIGTSDSLLFNTKNNPSSSESSDHYWSSCWSGLHPAYLVVFRLLSLSALAFFLAWDIHHWGPSIFIYYTEWTYSLTMMYFAIGTVISAHGCWLLHKHNNNDTPCLQESPGRGRVDLEDIPTTTSNLNYGKQQTPGFWGYLMQITYQISGGAVILTDIIFWCIIAPASSNTRLGLTLLMGCIHTVNVAFLLLDTCMNRLTFPWFRLAYFVLWSSAYVIFQWLIHLCGFTWWPYPFLKLSTPLAPLWYLVLAACHVVCYGLYALIVRGKDLLFSKLFPHSYIRSQY